MKKTLVLVLAAIMVLGVAGAAVAGTSAPIAGTGSPLEAQGTVNITAKVNPKLTLTIATPADGAGTELLLAWDITPGTAEPTAKDVTLTVSSNKDYTISRADTITGFPTGMGITAASASLAGPKTKGKDTLYTDSVNLTAADWWLVEASATDYTGSLLYTVTQ